MQQSGVSSTPEKIATSDVGGARPNDPLTDIQVNMNTILDNSSVGISFVTERRQLWVNRGMCELFGYRFDEMINQSTAMLFVCREDYEKLGREAYPLLGRGEQYVVEMEMLHRSGQRIWMRVSGKRVSGADAPASSIWVFENVSDRKQAELALREALLFNESILLASPVAMAVYRDEGQCVVANQAYADLVGLPRARLLAQNFLDIPTWQRSGLVDLCLAALRDSRQVAREIHVLSSWGQHIWVNAIIVPVVMHGQRHVLTQFFDLTEQKRSEEALRESEERFRTIADYTYDWEYWEGLNGEIVYISPSCQRITGYTPAEFIASPRLLYDIIHPEDAGLMDAHLLACQIDGGGVFDFRIVRKDGEVRWIAHGCRKVFGQDGRHIGKRVSNRDVTERKRAEEQVQQLAYYDVLTQLPNRRLLLDRLFLALSQARRYQRALAVMFLDLDNFKRVNDTLGHDVGDALLKEVALRLSACVRKVDTVARQGGDEFIIVLAEIAHPDDAARVAEKIIVALSAPLYLADKVLKVTTSIGIATHANGGDDSAELMKKADQALYAAKSAGRNTYRFFESPRPLHQESDA